MATNNPVSKKVIGIVEEITEKVSENPMVQKAEKATEELKNKGIAKYKELKEDVLEQASKIIDKGEAIIEDAKSTPKAKVTKKAAPKKTVAKKVTKTITKVAPKKTVAKKATVTKVVAKATPKKAVVKKATTATANVTKVVTEAAPKVKVEAVEVKKAVTDKVAEVKTEVTK